MNPRSIPVETIDLLIVDDRLDGATSMATALRKALRARSVEIRQNMAHAQLRLAAQPTPTLVLLDFNLGSLEPTGADIARWMLDQEQLTGVLRVLWSANPPDELPSPEELSQLFHAVIPKDMPFREVRTTLTTLLAMQANAAHNS